MACFDNILALKEGCDSSADPIYWIEDFNLTRTEIESIITSESTDVDTFISDKISFVKDVITNDIVNHFSNIQAKTLVAGHRVGIWNKNKTLVTGGNYRGIHLSVCEYQNYMNVDIAEVSTYTDFTGSLPLVVYDLMQNKLLDTITVTSQAGQISTAYPKLTYSTNKEPFELFIGYDTTGIQSYKTTIRSGSCCGKYTCSNHVVTSQGAEVDGDFINSNLTQLTNTAGVSVLYSVSCDLQGWLCPYVKRIALAVGYKVCSDIMHKGATSSPNSRTNDMVTLDNDQLKERHQWYEESYRETMDNLMKNIYVPQEGLCFQCTSPVTHKVILP